MTVGYVTSLRNDMVSLILTALGNGAKLKIYDGTRPATGGTATNLLVTMTGGSPFGTASGGVITANAITFGTAVANGNATWGRATSSADVFVFDFSVSATGDGGDMQILSTTIPIGADIYCSAFTLTEGNP